MPTNQLARTPTQELMIQEVAAIQADNSLLFPYLKVFDRDGVLVEFYPNTVQDTLYGRLDENPWQYILKARQLGSTTGIAAYLFAKALMTPGYKVLVVAHTRDAVKNIFQIYSTFYENLPPFLQFDTVEDSANAITFFHGGSIKVTSASSASGRGSTYQAIHASEVAFWKDPKDTIKNLFQAVHGNSTIILETTANGLNDFYNMWQDAEDNGYGKNFFPWTDEPSYVKDTLEYPVPERLAKYAKDHDLTQERINFAAWYLAIKCNGDWRTFLQEFAIDPTTCFVSTGTRVFSKVFPNATFTPGIEIHHKPQPGVPYVMGVDVASGSPTGDWSSWAILKVLPGDKFQVVATSLCKTTPLEFADEVFHWHKKYNALVVVENNSYGLPVLEKLKNLGANLYTKVRHDKATESFTETYGWNTNNTTRNILISSLVSVVEGNRINLDDQRMQYQMNTFIYTDSGRADHMPNGHDDLLIAIALGLQGREQAVVEYQTRQNRRPTTTDEAIQLEISTGVPISKLEAVGYFEDQEVFVPSENSDIVTVPW
jgi:hypothetical protein